MKQFVVATVRVSPRPDAKRMHLITAHTTAAILGLNREELERDRVNWGLEIVHCAPAGAENVAEEVLQLAELWEQAGRE